MAVEEGPSPGWLPATAHGPYDLAVDLGTAYVRVFARGRGLVADEPSLVRVWRSPLALESVGARARLPLADGLSCFPVQPLSEGVVRSDESAGWLLSVLLRRAWGLNLAAPRVLACAPTDATAEEIESLRSALRKAGAGTITVVPEPLAAAAGLGLDPAASHAQMVVDVGEGVTDVAVIRRARIETSLALREACFDLRTAVADFLASSQGLHPPAEAIEDLIRRADASDPDVVTLPLESDDTTARGGGGKRESAIGREALLGAMGPTLDRICGVVRDAWAALPEATREEVRTHGLWVTGGGARLHCLLERMRRVTSVEPRVPANPLHAVITGASRIALGGG